MTITEIRNIFESPYDIKVWKRLLQTQFTTKKKGTLYEFLNWIACHLFL